MSGSPVTEQGVTPLFEEVRALNPAAGEDERKALRRLLSLGTGPEQADLWPGDPETLRQAARQVNARESVRQNLLELAGQATREQHDIYDRLYFVFPEWRAEMLSWPLLQPTGRALSLLSGALIGLAERHWDWIDPEASRMILKPELTLPEILGLLGRIDGSARNVDVRSWILSAEAGPGHLQKRLHSHLVTVPLTTALATALSETVLATAPRSTALTAASLSEPAGEAALTLLAILGDLSGARPLPRSAQTRLRLRGLGASVREELLWLGAQHAGSAAAEALRELNAPAGDVLDWHRASISSENPSGWSPPAYHQARERRGAWKETRPYSWHLSETDQLTLWLLNEDHNSKERWDILSEQPQTWTPARRQAAALAAARARTAHLGQHAPGQEVTRLKTSVDQAEANWRRLQRAWLQVDAPHAENHTDHPEAP